MGKTSFALSLAKNIAIDEKIPVAFFSLEMNNLQLVNRLISNVCSIPGGKILNGQLTDDEWKRFDNNIGKMQGAPLYVDDTAGLSIFELRTKARRLVKEKKVELIMIDYLQLMNASGTKFNSRQEEVSTISRSLKGLAKELDIPIIALSQLSRAVEQRPGDQGKVPQLSDLRESGAIEQDADMVIFVHRPEYYHILEDSQGNSLKGMAQICIAKHRKGATKDVTLSFKGEFTRFANPDEYDQYATSSPTEGSFRASRMNENIIADDPLDGGAGPYSNDVPY
jgi:replicative DNA helicase